MWLVMWHGLKHTGFQDIEFIVVCWGATEMRVHSVHEKYKKKKKYLNAAISLQSCNRNVCAEVACKDATLREKS